MFIAPLLPSRSRPADIADVTVEEFYQFSNVLTAPRDSTELAGLQAAISRMANSRVMLPERLAALSEAARALRRVSRTALGKTIVVPLLDTPSHLHMFGSMVSMVQELAAGEYTGHNGVACRTLVGAHGIGKTTVARAFVFVCKAAFPGVIPLYFTAAGLDKPENSFQRCRLGELMIAAAQAHGVKVNSRAADGLADALKAAGKRMLVIVDEVEELYASADPTKANVVASLGDLQEFGDRVDGRFAVLLCGSSASTCRLITAHVEHLSDRFRLIQSFNLPDLNDSNFRRLDIPSAPCNDSAQVFAILQQFLADDMAHVHVLPEANPIDSAFEPIDDTRLQYLARLLTFFVGTTPRAVVAAMKPDLGGILTVSHLASLADGRLALSSSRAQLPPIALPLFDELLRRMVKANGPLIAHCDPEGDGACYIPAILDGGWEEKKLQPLDYTDAVSAWSTVAEAQGLPLQTDDLNHLGVLLELLSDAGAISFRLHAGSDNLKVWPATAAQLVLYSKGTESARLREAATRTLAHLTLRWC